jgi:hypothetical protein
VPTTIYNNNSNCHYRLEAASALILSSGAMADINEGLRNMLQGLASSSAVSADTDRVCQDYSLPSLSLSLSLSLNLYLAVGLWLDTVTNNKSMFSMDVLNVMCACMVSLVVWN